jgi:hydrogenase-4 component F
MLGHWLAKGSLFISAGRVLQLTGTHRTDQVRALADRAPLLAGCLGLGVLALLGFPPFSLFASELGVVRAGFASGLGWVTALALVLVLVIAAALLSHVTRMLLGPPPAEIGERPATGTASSPDATEHAGTAIRVMNGGVATLTQPAVRTAAPATRPAPHRATTMLVPVVAALAACAVLGVYAGPLTTLLRAAAQIVATP